MNIKYQTIKTIIGRLNDASKAYYNGLPIMNDKEWDDLYDELVKLEDATGLIFNNSPTQNVGYEILDKLKEVKHGHPMLSLKKTKSIKDIEKFAQNYNSKIDLSLKCDGLTTSLEYDNGELVKAETRGNGIIGLNVIHNIKTVQNVPLHIPCKHKLIIDGETIINWRNFKVINKDGRYKHPRNLVSGALQYLNSKEAKARNMDFVPWRIIEGFNGESLYDDLQMLKDQGFSIVPIYRIDSIDEVSKTIEKIEKEAMDRFIPYDGIVVSIDDNNVSKTIPNTNKFFGHSMAYKFRDDLYETTIRDIEWNTSRTGLINPVAVFYPVDLDGAETTRATLHNVSYIEGLELGAGDTIQVYRSNMVIPKVHDNLTRSNTFKIPDTCPTCGGEAKIINENGSKVLKCMNPDCKAKLLSKFVNFVSRDAMNIQGLSEATLKRFIDLGWLKDYTDIYNLAEHKSEMKNLDGFGAKSVSSLLNSIEESRRCKLVNFVTALGIELVGKSTAKDICKLIDKISLSNNENSYDVFIKRIKQRKYFGHIDGIGINTSLSMDDYFKENLEMVEKLAEELEFEMPESKKEFAVDLTGMTFVVTGKVNKFANRNAIKDEIESRGGKVAGSVSKNTNYLVNNDVNSTSSKNKKAQQLGIPIIDEDRLIELLNGDMNE
jgi:DNA ligase (NAD+)